LRINAARDWQPVGFSSLVALAILLVSLAPCVQAESSLNQTIPTRTPIAFTPPPTAVPPPVDTPPPDASPYPTSPPGATPPSGAPPTPTLPALLGMLRLVKQVSWADALPGEEIEYSLLVETTTASDVTGIVIADQLDPALEPISVSATQGAAVVQGSSIRVHLGDLPAGRSALVLIRAQVRAEARPGQIILNQAFARFDGGQSSSNTVAAGLPPVGLPQTGASRRER